MNVCSQSHLSIFSLTTRCFRRSRLWSLRVLTVLTSASSPTGRRAPGKPTLWRWDDCHGKREQWCCFLWHNDDTYLSDGSRAWPTTPASTSELSACCSLRWRRKLQTGTTRSPSAWWRSTTRRYGEEPAWAGPESEFRCSWWWRWMSVDQLYKAGSFKWLQFVSICPAVM